MLSDFRGTLQDEEETERRVVLTEEDQSRAAIARQAKSEPKRPSPSGMWGWGLASTSAMTVQRTYGIQRGATRSWKINSSAVADLALCLKGSTHSWGVT